MEFEPRVVRGRIFMVQPRSPYAPCRHADSSKLPYSKLKCIHRSHLHVEAQTHASYDPCDLGDKIKPPYRLVRCNRRSHHYTNDKEWVYV